MHGGGKRVSDERDERRDGRTELAVQRNGNKSAKERRPCKTR